MWLSLEIFDGADRRVVCVESREHGGTAGIGVALEAFEFRAHVRSVLVAEVAIFFEGAIDDVFEAGGKIGIETDGRRGRAVQDGFENDTAGVATKGERARCHFVEDDAEREEVAARVEVFAADLLGRHVGDGAECAAGAGEMSFVRSLCCGGIGNGVGTDGSGAGNFGEAEVENFRAATLGDENVCGLDVAVNDASVVSGVEGVGAVDADFEEAFEFQRARGDEVLQRGAVEEFHCDKGAAVVFADVVDGADVGMIQRGGGACFTFEAFERLWVVGEIVGEKFEGDEAAEARVFGFVDHAHSATAEFFDDAVMRDCLADEAGRLRHRGRFYGAWPSESNRMGRKRGARVMMRAPN